MSPAADPRAGSPSPQATVIIPTYNWAPVLRYSIASVLAQTLADIELLVVGDACTDESADVVAGFADDRVTWINLPRNTGNQVGPNNAGLRQARGPVVAYLGHDDLWLPHHLEVLVAAIAAGPPGPVHGRCLLLAPGEAPRLYPADDYRYAAGDWLPPTSMAHPAALVRELGGWRDPEETGTRDVEADLWERCAAVGLPPRLVDRLTCVKLPAAYRRDVYRERPCAEQAAWSLRIEAAVDPEAALRGLVGDPSMASPGSMADVPLDVIADPQARAARRTARRREFKGLPPR